MKTALLALVLTTIAPSHITFTVLGVPVSLPVAWLVLASEVLAAAGITWLVVRALRLFRSSPWPRPVFPARGAW